MDTEEERPRKKPGRRPGKTHTEQLKAMLRPEEMARFVAKAEMAEMSYSEAVRAAIEAWRPRR